MHNEISVKKDSICKKTVDESLEWIHVQEIQNHIAKTMFKSQLHEGEVEVMILAMEQQADVVIIDDQNAKKYAKYLKLPVTGTLGVLMKAKQNGYISELKPVLDVMLQNGIYIKPSLIELCLKQMGEI